MSRCPERPRRASRTGPVSRVAPLVLAAVALAAVALAGCVPPGLPTDAPSIVGTAESVSGAQRGQSIRSMMVRGEPREGATYDAASVTVTRDTKVFAGTRESPRNAAAENISEGDELMIWFTGPVAESYPVQATAGTVLILE